jgi:peptidoglycan hydrolase-like protein with peptidoglycan-binding domain
VLVVAAGLGLAIAGPPSREEAITLQQPTTTGLGVTTTLLTVPATPPPAAAAPAFPGPIRLGDEGEGVRVWQQRMVERGWKLTVDGEYGNGAVAACKKFQGQKGLPVTGVVDQTTWSATWEAPLPDTVA